MKEEYIIVNKTALEKMREELNKGSAHWDGIYLSDYQMAQINLIDAIIKSQSTPLIPEIEKAYDEGMLFGTSTLLKRKTKQDYISNLKLNI